MEGQEGQEREFNFTGSSDGRTFALTVRQPYAQMLSTGERCVEIRSKRTQYRGDILVCSTQRYAYRGMEAGCVCGVVELWACKPVAELTETEWAHTRIPVGRRSSIRHGWAWMFRNARRVVEYPVHTPRKACRIDFNRDDLYTYPKVLYVDKIGLAEKSNKKTYRWQN